MYHFFLILIFDFKGCGRIIIDGDISPNGGKKLLNYKRPSKGASKFKADTSVIIIGLNCFKYRKVLVKLIPCLGFELNVPLVKIIQHNNSLSTRVSVTFTIILGGGLY